jgi:hypothetical protein
MAQSDQTKLEIKAIAAVMEALDILEAEGQRRVLWYAADSLGLNSQPQAQPATRANTKTIQLPPGTDMKATADALRAAGVPVRD